MKNIYLLITSLILFSAFATEGFSKSSSDKDYITSEFALGSNSTSLNFERLQTTFKDLDLSGFTGSVDWFSNLSKKETSLLEKNNNLDHLASIFTRQEGSFANHFSLLNNLTSLAGCEFTISASETQTCAGDSVTFTADPSTGGTFKWFVNTVYVGDGASFSIPNLVNDDQVSAILSPVDTTCGTEVSSTNTITIAVNIAAPVSLSITGPNAICSGQDVIYSILGGVNAIVNGGTNPGLQWLLNNTAIPGANGESYSTSTLIAGDVINLQVTSFEQCATPVPAISNEITISINPDASISAPINNEQIKCVGTEAIDDIVYTLGGGATGATISNLPAGVTGSVDSGIVTISGTPTVPGTFNYTVTTTGTCAQTSAIGTITVNPNASLTLASTSSNATACADGAITDIVYTVGGTGDNATIVGLPIGILGVYSAGTFTISGSTATIGSFPYTITAIGTCGDVTATGTITINEKLVPEVTIASSDTNNTICAGTSVTFTATTTNEGSTPSYQWQINGLGNFGADATFTPTGLTSGDIVTVILTSSETCVTSTTATSNVIITTINPIVTPSVSIAITTGNNPTCDGNAVTFTATPTNGGAPSYQWQINETNVGGANASTFTPSTLNTGNRVRVIMTTSASCVSQPTATSDAITMVVNPLLTPSVSITSSDADNIICPGSSVTFTATSNNQGSNPSYEWNIGTTTVVTNTSTFTTNAINNGDVVSVILTSSEPCLSTINVSSNAINIKVQSGVPSAPNNGATLGEIQINGPTSICPVQNGLIYSVIANSDPDVSYNWTLPTGFNITNGYNTNQITVNATNSAQIGERTISVNAVNTCGQSTATSMDVVVSSIVEIIAGSDLTVCKGTNSINLNGIISGLNIKNHRDWDWVTNGGGSFGDDKNLNTTFNLPTGIRNNGGSLIITLTSTKNVAGCLPTSHSFTLTVSKDATISDPSNKSQAVCINTAITPISFTIAEGGTGGNLTGSLPAGLTGSFSAGVFKITGNPTVAGTFNYTVNTTGNCTPQTSRSGTITVNPNHSISPAIINQTACVNTPITSTNFSIGGGATNATVIGLPNGVTGNFENGVFTISGTSSQSGSFPFSVTTTGNGCTAGTASGTLTINPAATINAGIDQTICAGNTATMAASIGGSASTGLWTTTGTGSFNSNSKNAIYSPSAADITSGSVYLTYTTNNQTAPCNSATDFMVLTINTLPTVNAGTDQLICGGSKASMTATLGGTATSGTWTSSGTGTFNNNEPSAIYSPSVTDISSGSVNLTYTTNDPDGPCGKIADFLVLTIKPLPTVNAGNDQTICAGSTATMSGSIGGSASTGIWSTTGTGGFNNNTKTAIYTPSAADITSGYVNLTYTTTNQTAPCTSVDDFMVLTINPQVTLNVGSDQTICSNQSALVVATLSSGATGTWSSSGTGSFNDITSDSTNYNPSAADISAGSVILTFKTNNALAPCTAVSDVLILTIKKQVVITTQPKNTTVCATQSGSLSAVAIGDNLNYQWYKVNAGGDILLSNSSGITGVNTNILSFASAVVANTGSYYVRVSGGTGCSTVQSETRTLSVNEVITISSQPVTQELCEGSNASFTVVSTGTTPTYQWYKVGSPDIILTNGSEITGVTTPNLGIINSTPDNNGGYYVIITGSGGTCGSVKSLTGNLTVTPTPAATISYAGTPFCSDAATQTVTRTGTAGGTYSAPTGLTIDPSTGTITPSTSTDGEYTVTYTIPAAGGCEEVKTTTSITINSLPEITAFTYAKSTYCESDVLTYTPNAITVTNSTEGTYSATAGLTINSSTGGFSPVGVAPKSYTITYTANNPNGCATVVNKTFEIIIEAEPDASFTYTDSVFCNYGAGPTPTPGFQTGGVFSGSSGLVINADTGEIDLSTSDAGSHTVYYTFDAVSGGCAEVQESQSIIITPLPTASITYSATAYCASDATTYENLYTLNSGGSFSVLPSSGLNINLTTGIITPSGSTPDDYTISYTIPASDGCAEVIASVNVTIDPIPVAAFNYDATEYCKTGSNPLLSYTGGGSAGIFSYTSSPSGLSLGLNSSTGAIDLSTSAAGTYTIINTIAASAGCVKVESTPQTITIFSDTTGGIITGFASDNETVISNNIIACHEGNGTLNLTGQSGSIIGWESSTNGGQLWTSIPDTTDSTYNFSGISSTTLFRAVLESGPCGPKNSAIALVNVIPSNIKPTVSPNNLQNMCFGQSVEYSYTSGFGTGQLLQGVGNFNSSNPEGWLVDRCGNCLNASANNSNPGPWKGTGPRTFHTISYDSKDGSFLIANGDYSSILESPTFNTFGLTTSTLDFYQAYDLKVGAQAIIELSLDGGTTYNITLSTISGPANSGNHSNGFNHTLIDLQNYIGQANLKIRFRYIGTISSAWAIDKFRVPDTRVNETIEIAGPGITLLGDGKFNYEPITPGITTIEVTSNLNGCISTTDGTTTLTVAANFAYAGKPITPVTGECGVATVNLNAYDNTKSAAENIADGAHDNNYVTGTNAGTGAVGTWTVSGGPGGCDLPSFSDINNPKSTFSGGGAGTYTLTWTVAGCSSDVTVTLEDCSMVNFDGIDDYATFGDAFNRSDNFSFEVWVKPNSITGTQTILSKRNANNIATGYDLSLNNATLVFNWNGAGTISSSHHLTTNRWYHVAVTFGGGSYQLYIDGTSVSTATGAAAPVTNTSKFLLGAMDQPPNKPVRHFNGYIEELRIWNASITQDQIRQMMNQRITSNGTAVAGEVVPLNVPGINWSDLAGYYRMDVSCGGLVNRPGDVVGKLRNMNAARQPNSAPLPYVSQAGGSWTDASTWLNGGVQQLPSSLGIDGITVDWNIVRTAHDITSSVQDLRVLGLLVDANRLSIQHTNDPNDGQSLTVSKYLKIDGVLDLVGESQLLQPEGSIVDYTGTGRLERDQQGTGNKFNYNYWGSPVSTAGPAGSRTYRLNDILYDGNANAPVGWIPGHDGNPGPPINLARRWLYTFNGLAWNPINETSILNSGHGFIMKGGDVTGSSDKNYTFKGQPNNGTIKVNINGANATVVVGNPYTSAIDADEFIKNNLLVMEEFSALQFWQQSTASASHVLRQYEGGYASYTMAGGTLPVQPPEIAGLGGVSKIPTRYIPVGQGFYVSGGPGGGQFEFNNTQRVFVKEAGGNSIFFRGLNNNSKTEQKRDAAATGENAIQRVRLAFKNPEGATRHLLLGFTPDNAATDGIDNGYDALNNNDIPSDLSFAIAGKKFVIQGAGEFDSTKKYPLDMTLAIKGPIEISLTDLENFDAPIDVYIHDAHLDTYTQINAVSFQLQLEKGNYTDRFSLVFQPDATLSTIDQDFKEIQVKYLQKTDEIYVKTPASIEVRQVYLINMAGQAVKAWNMTNMNFGQEFKILGKGISDGNYILKVETSTNSYSKKMIIKYK